MTYQFTLEKKTALGIGTFSSNPLTVTDLAAFLYGNSTLSRIKAGKFNFMLAMIAQAGTTNWFAECSDDGITWYVIETGASAAVGATAMFKSYPIIASFYRVRLVQTVGASTPWLSTSLSD